MKRSTSENTLVCRVALEVAVTLDEDGIPVDEDVDEAFSFSFPRLVADENARKKLCGSLDGVETEDRDGPAILEPVVDCKPGRVFGRFALAGWNVARDL